MKVLLFVSEGGKEFEVDCKRCGIVWVSKRVCWYRSNIVVINFGSKRNENGCRIRWIYWIVEYGIGKRV